MGIPVGMDMGIEIPSHGSPGLCRGYGDSRGYGDRNSVPTAALDSAVGMGIPMGMGIEIPSPRQPCYLRDRSRSADSVRRDLKSFLFSCYYSLVWFGLV